MHIRNTRGVIVPADEKMEAFYADCLNATDGSNSQRDAGDIRRSFIGQEPSMAERKERARLLILHHIAQFSLQRRIGDHVYGGLTDDMAFHGGAFSHPAAIPGDLVAIQSAPPTKWYLGWLISKQWPEGHACEQYTIESIEDGELCNWSNVGLIYYDRSQVAEHPEWRWSDAQHAFKDRWWNACYKVRDAYMYLPIFPAFDGEGVRLGVRVRFGLSSTIVSRDFPAWRKVTKAQMLAFYDSASAELAAEPPKPP